MSANRSEKCHILSGSYLLLGKPEAATGDVL